MTIKSYRVIFKRWVTLQLCSLKKLITIGSAIDVIREISKQTSLIALNTAINNAKLASKVVALRL